MQTKIVTMANGIRILMVNQPGVESVTIGAFVNVGSRNESKKLNGISHFLEHMAFKGTEKRGYLDISSDIERLGANMNAYTSEDRTAYHMSGLKNHLPIFVELLSDILINSTLPEDEIENERGVIIQEYERSSDDPGRTSYALFDKAAYGDTPLGRMILGTKSNIKRFTRDELMGYQKAHYTGKNMIVAVAGNVDFDNAVALIEQHFSAIAPGTVSDVPTPTYLGGIEVSKRSFKQSHVAMGFPISTLRDDFYSDMVMGHVLGSGMSSPLFNEIREKRSLAYSVTSFSYIQEKYGVMYLSAGTTFDHLDEFFNATCDLLIQHKDKINPVDLERAKNLIEVSEIRSLERPFSLASGFVDDLFIHGELQSKEQSIANIRAVTSEQVRDSFARMLSRAPTISIVGKGADEKYLDIVKAKLA